MSKSPLNVLSLPNPVKQSTVWKLLTAAKKMLTAGAKTSGVKKTGSFLSRATRESWLYRWLTKEPEPDVIVIDLRETWTVGPIIRLLDTGIETLGRSYADSTLQRVNEAIARRFYRAPIRHGSAVLLLTFLLTGVLLSLAGKLSGTVLLGLGVGALVSVGRLFVNISWPDIREAKSVRLLVSVFEPPDHPENSNK